MNETDADGDTSDQHFLMVTLLAAASKTRLRLSNVAMSLDVMPMQKHMSLARILVNCCAETVEVVNKYCFVHSVCGANTTRESLTRLLVS